VDPNNDVDLGPDSEGSSGSEREGMAEVVQESHGEPLLECMGRLTRLKSLVLSVDQESIHEAGGACEQNIWQQLAL